MNCHEFEEWAGQYLSDEVEGPLRTELDRHRDTCEACGRLLERCTEIDERVRAAVWADDVDASSVVAGARQRIGGRAERVRWMGIAAGVVLLLGGLAFWQQTRVVPTQLAAAARDHDAEIVRNGHRRWREAPEDIQKLLSQYKIDSAEVDALLRVGFVLQKAKQCGIDGAPALHMVFSDGTRAMSVFVPSVGVRTTGGEAQLNGVTVAAFRRGSLSGIVAAPERKLCDEAVRRLSAL